jgi:hypothetical protein
VRNPPPPARRNSKGKGPVALDFVNFQELGGGGSKWKEMIKGR